MKRTEWRYVRPDGGIDIVTQGPVGRTLGVVRVLVFAFLVIALLTALFTGQWAAFGALLLLVGIFMPNYAKRRRDASRLIRRS